MRTIDPVLAAAMLEGKGEPIARARLYDYDGTAFLYQGSVDLDNYEMRGQTCSCVSRSLISGVAFTIERGVQIAGVEYVEESQYFFVTKNERGDGIYEASGYFLPGGIVSSSHLADVSAQSFCGSILSDFALTLSVSSAEAWHGWQFYPLGVALQLTAAGLKNLLSRKYRAEMYPRKSGEICVYSPSLYLLGSPLNVSLVGARRIGEQSRGFSLAWTDELEVRHEYAYMSPSEFVIDIGFVPSSVAYGAVGKLAFVQSAGVVWTGRPNLALEEGDFIRVVVDGISTNVVITLVEKFNRSSSCPVWQQTVMQSGLARSASASSLAGGLISSMHGSALLDTSSFDGNLDPTVSTVQALAERVDDLVLAPITTAPNDVQVGSMGQWVTKSLAEFGTILRTVLDSVYAASAHASRHKSGGADAIKLDELSAPTDVTTLNASTSAHGLAPKAVAPSSGLINVLGIANGETAYSNKALFDSTAPAALGTATAGTATVAARRDHVHDKQTILLPFGVYAGVGPFSADATPYAVTIDRTMTLVKLTYAFYVGTNNASNYWTINLVNSSATVIKALNTSALAGNGFYQLSHTFAATTVDTSDSMLRVQVVKTGTPGSIYPAGPILEVRI